MNCSNRKKNKINLHHLLLGALFIILQTGCSKNTPIEVSAPVDSPSSTAPKSVGWPLSDVDAAESFTPTINPRRAQYDAYRRQECDNAPLMHALGTERTMYCLKKICESTPGASFDSRQKECHCSQGLAFRAENRTGFCLPLGWIDGEDYDRNRHTLDATLINSTPTTGSNNASPASLDALFTTRISLASATNNDENRLRNILTELRAMPIEFATQSLHSSHFTIGAIPESDSDRALLASEIAMAAEASVHFGPGVNLLNTVLPYGYYEPNLSFAAAALGSKTALNSLSSAQKRDFYRVSELLPTETVSTFEELRAVSFAANALFSQHELTHQNEALLEQDAVSLAGCAEYCVMEQRINLPLFSNLEIKYEKIYFLGTKVNSRIVVRKLDTKKILAIVLLNPGNGVSSIIHITHMTYERNQSRYVSYSRIYDRHWNQISSQEYPVTDNLPTLLSDLRSLAIQSTATSNAEIESTAKAAICETSWPAHGFDRLQGPLILGAGFNTNLPLLDETAQNPANHIPSLFGWNMISRTLEEYFGALMMGDFTGVLANQTNTHPITVANTFFAAGENNHGNRGAIAPMGATYGCMSPEQYPNWKEELLDRGVRVMNLSFSELKSRDLCTDHYTFVFNDSAEPILYVAAAGNAGWLGNRLVCPQNILAGHNNGIIVGSLDSRSAHQMAPWSNFGSRSVDIATASATNSTLNTEGTSVAAPVVSKVAAEIFAEIPTLKVRDVRLAILLGAEIYDLSHPLPVRSGGSLNVANAKALARMMANERRRTQATTPFNGGELRGFIKKLFCEQTNDQIHTTVSTCDVASRRIEILMENGIL